MPSSSSRAANSCDSGASYSITGTIAGGGLAAALALPLVHVMMAVGIAPGLLFATLRQNRLAAVSFLLGLAAVVVQGHEVGHGLDVRVDVVELPGQLEPAPCVGQGLVGTAHQVQAPGEVHRSGRGLPSPGRHAGGPARWARPRRVGRPP